MKKKLMTYVRKGEKKISTYGTISTSLFYV